MKQTETYKLKLIETSDTFSPDALNRNAETLETELARVDAAAAAVQSAAAKAQSTADTAQSAAAKAQCTADSKLGQTATAAAAAKLETPRTIQVNLNKTTAASFDGTEDVAPGVTGTLPISRGGTNKTSWTASRLIYTSGTADLSELSRPSANGSILRQDVSGNPYWTSPEKLVTALGAARCVTFVHTGTGATSVTHTFGFPPKLVMMWDSFYPYNLIAVVRDQTQASRFNSNSSTMIFDLAWTDTGVTFTSKYPNTANAPDFIANSLSFKYFGVAIG